MVKGIVKKKYYRITFKTTSPLAIGSGENVGTDKDIIINSERKPFIPASAIAGVCSDLLRKKADDKQNSEIDEYLGFVRIEGTESGESRVIFYDGVMKEADDFVISVRDSVALDDFKTDVPGAKFDMEVLEPGIVFTTYLEQNYYTENDDKDYAEYIAGLFCSGSVRFGGKTTRGYGEISTQKIDSVSFDFVRNGEPQEKEFDRWLKFDLYDESSLEKEGIPIEKRWIPVEYNGEVSQNKKICVSLRQKGGISIRKYTTEQSDGNSPQPDFEQLYIHKNGKKEAVIPGTSWAGAIRHRMKELGMNEKLGNDLFGYVAGNTSKSKSKIIFSETVLNEAKEKVLSRNAIDRFSGGTADKALFTEKTYYGGTTELIISFDDGLVKEDDSWKSILAACLTDLHFGFLAVGGETSIGRGLFEITSITGTSKQDIPDKKEEIFNYILNKIKEVMPDGRN